MESTYLIGAIYNYIVSLSLILKEANRRKNIMIKRREKGSITLFTLIAMMFLLTIAFTAYTSAMIKLQAQNEDLERIKASYEQDLTEEGLASLYEKLTRPKWK